MILSSVKDRTADADAWGNVDTCLQNLQMEGKHSGSLTEGKRSSFFVHVFSIISDTSNDLRISCNYLRQSVSLSALYQQFFD